MKKYITLILISLICLCSTKADTDPFPLTPAQEEALEQLPRNLARGYLRRVHRQHKIDVQFMQEHEGSYYDGYGIITAHSPANRYPY